MTTGGERPVQRALYFRLGVPLLTRFILFAKPNESNRLKVGKFHLQYMC